MGTIDDGARDPAIFAGRHLSYCSITVSRRRLVCTDPAQTPDHTRNELVPGLGGPKIRARKLTRKSELIRFTSAKWHAFSVTLLICDPDMVPFTGMRALFPDECPGPPSV